MSNVLEVCSGVRGGRVLLMLSAAVAIAGCGRSDRTQARPATPASPPAMTAESDQGRYEGQGRDEAGLANAPAQAQPATGAAVAVQSSEQYGEYLVDGRGRTLYLFTPDRKAQSSTCYDACARMWPPLTTEERPELAAPGLNPALLGTITRSDGTKQVTYNGWPLYYYVQDRRSAEVTGQDIHSFDGEWYLVAPSGEKNERKASMQSRR